LQQFNKQQFIEKQQVNQLKPMKLNCLLAIGVVGVPPHGKRLLGISKSNLPSQRRRSRVCQKFF